MTNTADEEEGFFSMGRLEEVSRHSSSGGNGGDSWATFTWGRAQKNFWETNGEILTLSLSRKGEGVRGVNNSAPRHKRGIVQTGGGVFFS